MPGEMLEGWRTAELADIAKLSMGETLLSQHLTGDGIPVFSANTDDGPWGFTSNNRRRLRRGDIVVGARGSIGFPRRPDFDAFTCTQTTIAVEPDRDVVDSEYLHHALCATDILGIASQQAVPMLTIGSLSPLEVDLPPLNEQRRIAEVLRSVDEAIAAADDVATAILRANRTMQHELLKVSPDGTLNDLPSDWVVCPLEELASVERGKFSIRPRNDPRYFGGSTPFIQTGDITGAGEYITRHTQTLNELGVGVSRVFPAGTIMTTIAANIGDFAIASYPVACPDSVVGIEAKPDVEPFWLYSALTCFKVALDRAATQNAQKNINLQTLRPLQIPVPPHTMMMELAETLSAAADGARQAKAAVANLMTLKQAIMSDLLSGRVRVPA